jgi:hypothetical protein
VIFVLVAAVGYPIVNACWHTGFCSVQGIKWIWHMTHKDEYGLIGLHLEPGREYYFELRPATFLSDYPQHAPVSAEQIEPQETVVIGKVYPNQKKDQYVGYKRERASFPQPIDPSKLGIVVNGDYFFSIDESGNLGAQLSIDQALRSPRYAKVTLYLQRVTSAELVSWVTEGRNKYTYWPSTGYLKENVGSRIEDGEKKEWRECYAEADGSHTPCSDTSKKY